MLQAGFFCAVMRSLHAPASVVSGFCRPFDPRLVAQWQRDLIKKYLRGTERVSVATELAGALDVFARIRD
jgi:hypothetical protein